MYTEFGMLAGQFDKGVTGRAGSHFGFDGVEPIQQAIEFGGGYHVQAQKIQRKKAAAMVRGCLMLCRSLLCGFERLR